MMHTSKLLLVPSDVMNKDTSEDSFLSALDTEMRKILDQKELPTDQKLAAYNQLLHRYLKANEKRNSPFEIKVQEPENKPDVYDDEILDGIPIRNKKNAKLLINSIKKNPEISWSDTGELIAGGLKIDGSNIIDLIHDFSRERRPHNPAVGADVLARLLKKSNVPLEFIGNKNRLKLINNDSNILLATPNEILPNNTPRPASRTRRQPARRNNLVWEEM